MKQSRGAISRCKFSAPYDKMFPMKTYQVYIGMGGNIGDTVSILKCSLNEMNALEGVSGLRCSNFYKTSPVGPVQQDDYVNAVCTFKTVLTPVELHQRLREIEQKLGKFSKPKDHPRVIDLDLLLHGMEVVNEKDLEVPHPKWNERLFVLVPMKELVDRLTFKDSSGEQVTLDLDDVIRHFDNVNNETLEIIKG